MSVTAPITNISRASLHDGPGVRTVVYFKGCTLRCKWCHNPETWSVSPQVLYAQSKCIHCGRCVSLCPKHHLISGNEMQYLRNGCTVCGRCAEACPTLALQICGEEKTVDELLSQIRKDTHHYDASGGGVTFSGGECLLYPDFLAALARRCKETGISTAVESAFCVPWENVEAVLPYIDLFFADLKIPSPEKHRAYTGQDNRLIVDNIRALSDCHNNITLRIPIIPTVNDSDDDIEGFAQIINTFGTGIRDVELLRYNHLAESKYHLIGKTYEKYADRSHNDTEMEHLRAALADKTDRHCYFV